MPATRFSLERFHQHDHHLQVQQRHLGNNIVEQEGFGERAANDSDDPQHFASWESSQCDYCDSMVLETLPNAPPVPPIQKYPIHRSQAHLHNSPSFYDVQPNRSTLLAAAPPNPCSSDGSPMKDPFSMLTPVRADTSTVPIISVTVPPSQESSLQPQLDYSQPSNTTPHQSDARKLNYTNCNRLPLSQDLSFSAASVSGTPTSVRIVGSPLHPLRTYVIDNITTYSNTTGPRETPEVCQLNARSNDDSPDASPVSRSSYRSSISYLDVKTPETFPSTVSITPCKPLPPCAHHQKELDYSAREHARLSRIKGIRTTASHGCSTKSKKQLQQHCIPTASYALKLNDLTVHENKTLFSILPVAVFVDTIFDFLDYRDICSVALTCHTFLDWMHSSTQIPNDAATIFNNKRSLFKLIPSHLPIINFTPMDVTRALLPSELQHTDALFHTVCSSPITVNTQSRIRHVRLGSWWNQLTFEEREGLASLLCHSALESITVDPAFYHCTCPICLPCDDNSSIRDHILQGSLACCIPQNNDNCTSHTLNSTSICGYCQQNTTHRRCRDLVVGRENTALSFSTPDARSCLTGNTGEPRRIYNRTEELLYMSVEEDSTETTSLFEQFYRRWRQRRPRILYSQPGGVATVGYREHANRHRDEYVSSRPSDSIQLPDSHASRRTLSAETDDESDPFPTLPLSDATISEFELQLHRLRDPRPWIQLETYDSVSTSTSGPVTQCEVEEHDLNPCNENPSDEEYSTLSVPFRNTSRRFHRMDAMSRGLISDTASRASSLLPSEDEPAATRDHFSRSLQDTVCYCENMAMYQFSSTVSSPNSNDSRPNAFSSTTQQTAAINSIRAINDDVRTVSEEQPFLTEPACYFTMEAGNSHTAGRTLGARVLEIAKRHACDRFLWVLRLMCACRRTVKRADFSNLPKMLQPALDGREHAPHLPVKLDALSERLHFPCLRKLYFGSAIDCRLIVPLLDFCSYPQLKEVTLLGLPIRYTTLTPQFGTEPTIVFGPEHPVDYDSDRESRTLLGSTLYLPAVYNGGVDDSLQPQGYGVYVSREYNYEGSFIDGRNHGWGRMISKCGEMYEGHWEQGRRHGYGVVKQADGKLLEGEWADDVLHGRGFMETADGLRYEGEWNCGVLQGWGVLSKAGHLLAFGQFYEGKPHGWIRCRRGCTANSFDICSLTPGNLFVGDSFAENLSAEESLSDKPFAELLTADHPTVEDSITEHPIAENRTAEDLTPENPTLEDAIAGNLIVEDPIAENMFAHRQGDAVPPSSGVQHVDGLNSFVAYSQPFNVPFEQGTGKATVQADTHTAINIQKVKNEQLGAAASHECRCVTLFHPIISKEIEDDFDIVFEPDSLWEEHVPKHERVYSSNRKQTSGDSLSNGLRKKCITSACSQLERVLEHPLWRDVWRYSRRHDDPIHPIMSSPRSAASDSDTPPCRWNTHPPQRIDNSMTHSSNILLLNARLAHQRPGFHRRTIRGYESRHRTRPSVPNWIIPILERLTLQ